jgi:predicted DCC family thiol-disulfide oxidoreductase YuxK
MGSSSSLNLRDIKSIILFDGVCNLCNGSVQFIIKRDPDSKFMYASLQSPFGQEQLDRLGKDKSELHSIILLQNGKAFERSDAALEIARRLTGLWPMLYSFKIIPRFMRDGIYNWIAKNRYRFFGKKDQCWIPTADLKSRFIE